MRIEVPLLFSPSTLASLRAWGQFLSKDASMNLHLFNGFLRSVTIGAFASGLLVPSGVSAATGGVQTSTGTLVGAVTCGADEITPAANAVVSVAVLNMETRSSSGGRFELRDVPAGQPVRIDIAADPQQSFMSSRFDVVVAPGQTLDIGSVDIVACPPPSSPPVVMTDQEMEQRGNPND
jgi:hypothetical protein